MTNSSRAWLAAIALGLGLAFMAALVLRSTPDAPLVSTASTCEDRVFPYVQRACEPASVSSVQPKPTAPPAHAQPGTETVSRPNPPLPDAIAPAVQVAAPLQGPEPPALEPPAEPAQPSPVPEVAVAEPPPAPAQPDAVPPRPASQELDTPAHAIEGNGVSTPSPSPKAPAVQRAAPQKIAALRRPRTLVRGAARKPVQISHRRSPSKAVRVAKTKPQPRSVRNRPLPRQIQATVPRAAPECEEPILARSARSTCPPSGWPRRTAHGSHRGGQLLPG